MLQTISLSSKRHFQIFSNAKLQKFECSTNQSKASDNSKLGCSYGRFTLVTPNSSDKWRAPLFQNRTNNKNETTSKSAFLLC